MSRYVATMQSVSVSTAKTVVEVVGAADAITTLHEAWISQDASETSTQEVAVLKRFATTGTGTAFTALLLSPTTDAAFGGTAKTNMTVEGGTPVIIVQEAFNILNGWYYKPVPDARFIFPPSNGFGIGFAVAPAAAITISAGVIFEEIG